MALKAILPCLLWEQDFHLEVLDLTQSPGNTVQKKASKLVEHEQTDGQGFAFQSGEQLQNGKVLKTRGWRKTT